MRWSAKKLSPIGLDLGTHSFKAVQLCGSDVSAAVTLERTEPGAALSATEIARLRDVLWRRGFVGRDVVIAVPNESVMTSLIELPPRTPGMPVPQLAAAEFARAHKADAAGLTLSTWELPAADRASRATYLLGVGAKSDQLEAHVDLLEAGGFNVIAVDDPYSAAVRGCLHGSGAANGLCAIIDLGWTCWSLSIVKGSVVVYTRDLSDSGLAELFDEANESLTLKPDEVKHALWRHGLTASAVDMEADAADPAVIAVFTTNLNRALKEISQAIGYASHQYPDAVMHRVHIAGGAALVPGVAERFVSALGLPCGVGTGLVPPSADQMAALGLALMQEGAQ